MHEPSLFEVPGVDAAATASAPFAGTGDTGVDGTRAVSPENAPPIARTSDPATSKDAAESHGQRMTNVDLLVAAASRPHGLCAFEGNAVLGRPLSPTGEAGKRLSDAARLGMLAPSGETRTCPVSGRQQQVYVLNMPLAHAPRWDGPAVGEIIHCAIADHKAGMTSVWRCPFDPCRRRDPFTSAAGLSRHLRAAHGAHSHEGVAA